MNITKHNCESFFLDYYEKNLSPVEVAEVLFFLEENPDMKEVFEGYEAIFLEADKVNFSGKESLKKKYSKEELDIILSSDITKTNSEQFFVAAAEGILSEEQTQKLHSFLVQHPELKKDFDLFQKCKLPGEKIVFEHKHLLKKETINAQNSEEYFVRSMEGDLNLTEQKWLAAFLQTNPEYKKEFELFRHTVLVPEKISFEFKEQLKKKEKRPVIIPLFSQRTAYYAAAAAVLLLAGLFFFFRTDNDNATYVAEKPHTSVNKAVKAKPNENYATPESKNIVSPGIDQQIKNETAQVKISKNSSVNKNLTAQKPQVKEEKIVPAPVMVESKMGEEPLIAKKAEEKKIEEAKVEDVIAAKKTEEKTDSASVKAVSNEAAVSVSAEQKAASEYQTVAAFVNKKIRAALGVKKPTECETTSPDKIDMWNLAMVVKKEVQKVIGTKALDVNKVCDGTGEKVEYVFTAGNFEISKISAR